MWNRLHLPAQTVLLLAGVLLIPQTSQAAEQPTPVKPEEARQHVGELVSVTFEVKASKFSMNRNTVFLDSTENFRDEKNLGIAISSQGIKDLKDSRQIDAPADHFRNKTIRVVGTLVLEDERPYIKVNKAEQITETE